MDSQFPVEEDFDNVVDSYSVTINGFIFCTRHGLEVCDKCPTDNRSSNNMAVEDMLHERLTEEEYNTKWKGDEREPFSIAPHKKVACDECFNWGEQLYRGIHGGRKPRVSRLSRKSRDHTAEDRIN
ncbi:hypothetical protein PS6_010460 [Mucor atramentarius]